MTSITAYGAVEEIGGNRFIVEEGADRLLLDFGTSFGCLNQFFHEYLNPRKANGLGDWFRMGLAPDIPGVYRQDYRQQMGRKPEPLGVSAALFTHAHIDHVGLLPLLRPDVPVHMSDGARVIMETLQNTGTQGNRDYTEFFEDFRWYENKKGGQSKATRSTSEPVPRPIVTEPEIDVDGFNVEAYEVDHSLPGARGYVVETKKGTIAYTGDFRFHGRNPDASKKFAQRLGGADVLITEGTNMGKERPDEGYSDLPGPGSEIDVRDRVTDHVEPEGGFVAINYPPRDLDRILSFWEAAQKTSRRLLLTPKQAYMMQRFHDLDPKVPGLDDRNVGIYLPRRGWGLLWDDEARQADPLSVAREYAGFERDYLTMDNAFDARAVKAEPAAYMVYVDLFNATELIDLDPKGGTYVYSKTEAFNPEMDLDLGKLRNWVDHFGLSFVKAHASGHASRDELVGVIDEAKPKRIVPVHTENVKAFETAYGDRVVRAKLGQEIPL